MEKKTVFLVCLLIFQSPVFLFSQENTDRIVSQDSTFDAAFATEFSVKQLILPASLITIGAFGLGNEYIKSVNRDIKGEIALHRSNYIHADDYMQYLPAVSVYGLSLAGAKAKHNYLDRTLVMATSYLSMSIFVNVMKYSISSPRPDSPETTNSFPSGHTATAFVGAELVRIEYGDDSPWYGIAAYSIATSVGLLRIYNERHWATDVIAGAGFGILSARIGYWLLPVTKQLFNKKDKKEKAGASLLIISPYYTIQQGGLSLSYQF